MSTSAICAHRHPDGSFCKRWASKDSRFCYRHQPKQWQDPNKHDAVHPLARLTTLGDVFNVVRETLNAVRLGHISPAQAYATGYMVDRWLRVHARLSWQDREKALESQMLPEALEEVAQTQRLREHEQVPEPEQEAAPEPEEEPVPVPPLRGRRLEGEELTRVLLAGAIAPLKAGTKPGRDGSG